MNADYEIVKYNPAFKPLVAELQKHMWSSDAELNTRYLEWKYERNPRPGEPLICLAFHQRDLVGMRGFHAATLEAGTPSRAFSVLIAGDALIAPGHRDRGLVTRLMNMAYSAVPDRDYRFLLSVGGANRVNTLGLLTLGWKSAGALKPMGRITMRARCSHQLSRAMARLPLLWRYSDTRTLFSADHRNSFRRLDALMSRRGPSTRLPISLERNPRVDAMVELVEHLGHDGRIRYVRDRDYLTWRFQNPLSEYRFIYWGEERLEGYLVLSRRVSDLGHWNRVYIADLEASDTRIRSQLLTAAIRWGRFPELAVWTANLAADEAQLLRSRGFVAIDPHDTVRGCPCVLVRPLGSHPVATAWMLDGLRVLDPESWDIRVLYSMRA